MCYWHKNYFKDITNHIIQLRPPEEALMDFGHIDLFIGNSAETELWQPILNWIEGQMFGVVSSGENDMKFEIK